MTDAAGVQSSKPFVKRLKDLECVVKQLQAVISALPVSLTVVQDLLQKFRQLQKRLAATHRINENNGFDLKLNAVRNKAVSFYRAN